jgi:hypothetical protein
MQSYPSTETNGNTSIEEAVEAVRHATDFDPYAQKIQAIKLIREMTGLGLKESKDIVDHNFSRPREDDVSLEDILTDLRRREGREDEPPRPAAPVTVAIDVRRERKRETDRRYRARVRQRLAASLPPYVAPADDIVWASVRSMPADDLRRVLKTTGLTLAIVHRNGSEDVS